MTRFLPHLIVLLAVLFALSPFVSEGFNGYRPEQFPVVEDSWPIQPSGWAFSIWGLIYLWLIAGSILGALQAKRDNDWQQMRASLAISLFVGVFWIKAANEAPVIASIMIVVMTGSAIAAFLRSGTRDRLWQSAPIGLYAGWLTAAAAVSTAIILSGYGILPSLQAALLLIVATLVVALWVQNQRPDQPIYSMAVGWALTGIAAANIDADQPVVFVFAVFGILALVSQFFFNRRRAYRG